MSAVLGDKAKFAIEAEIVERIDEWALGHYRFWARGSAIGDWEDMADLGGCSSWMRDFLENRVDRSSPSLEEMSAVDVMRTLYDDVMPRPPGPDGRRERTWTTEDALRNAETIRRFHIAHLGMSAFDRVDMLLMEAADGRQRLIWRDVSDSEIHEVILNPGEIEKVGEKFCEWFEKTTRAD